MLEISPGVEKKLDETFRELERTATSALRQEGFPTATQRHERSLALRYQGQSFELEIKRTSGNIASEFHRAHRERYGYAQQSTIVEIVSARVRSSGIVEKLPQRRLNASRGKQDSKPARNVSAYLNGKDWSVAVYHRVDLPVGVRLRTPCIVTEYSSTTLIPADTPAEVDGYGNLIIQVESTGQ
jgi:N-methylhydantoinase A